MPEVFADEKADAAEARVEGANGITPCEEAAFIEQAVGGQINLVMNVENFSA